MNSVVKLVSDLSDQGKIKITHKDEKDIDSNKEIDRQFDFFRRAENVKNIIETFEKLGKEGKLEFSDVESAYNNLGNAYARLDDNEDAIRSYKKALELKIDRAGIYTDLGTSYAKLGNSEEAIKMFRKAIETFEREKVTRLILGLKS